MLVRVPPCAAAVVLGEPGWAHTRPSSCAPCMLWFCFVPACGCMRAAICTSGQPHKSCPLLRHTAGVALPGFCLAGSATSLAHRSPLSTLLSWQAGESDPDIFFTDRPRELFPGQRNRECLSFFADEEPGLLRGRSPMQCYAEFMR